MWLKIGYCLLSFCWLGILCVKFECHVNIPNFSSCSHCTTSHYYLSTAVLYLTSSIQLLISDAYIQSMILFLRKQKKISNISIIQRFLLLKPNKITCHRGSGWSVLDSVTITHSLSSGRFVIYLFILFVYYKKHLNILTTVKDSSSFLHFCRGLVFQKWNWILSISIIIKRTQIH